MEFDFDVEQAFEVWGYGKKYFSLDAIKDENILNYYGNTASHILTVLKKLEGDFNKSQAYKAETTKEMFDKSIEDFLKLYPGFPSKNVLTWLGNKYCFYWK